MIYVYFLFDIHLGDGYSFKHPQEWEEQGSADVKLVTLVNSSREYKYVEQKFIKAVFSGRPEWANQFNKHTFMVTQVVKTYLKYDKYNVITVFEKREENVRPIKTVVKVIKGFTPFFFLF